MSTQIKYKGEIITTFDKGTITLNTEGDKLKGDIEIISTGGGADAIPEWDGLLTTTSALVIFFVINGEVYEAEEGMTWGEWVTTNYGKGYFIASDGVRIKSETGLIVFDVTVEDTISSEYSYPLVSDPV